MRNRLRARAALAALLLAAACGKKAPPIRPERLVPEEVRISTVRNVSDGVRLFWSAPKRRADGKPLEGLRRFLILRAEGSSKQACLAPGNAFARSGSVEAVPEQDSVYTFLDQDVRPGRWYAYRVIAEDNRGEFSGPPPSQPTIRRGVAPPKAPAPEVVVGDGFLSFRMPPFPDRVDGWYVYRAPTGTTLPILPHFPEPVTSREFTDAGLTNDVPYQYAVSWLSYDEGFPVEGEHSEPVTAAARDLVAPPAPRALVGVAVKNTVDLRWERVEEAGVRYHVYRRLESELGFRVVTPEPISANAYVDTVKAGRYVYSVTSLDEAGNESPRSPETAVRVR